MVNNMWARIENGTVAEITDINPVGRFHPSLKWVACGADAAPGWTYDGESFTAPEAPEVDHRAAIAAERYKHEIYGITWQGYGIATDRESQQKMSDERSAVKDGLRTDGKGWKCLDLESGVATFRPTTNSEILDITEAAYRYVSACFDREGELLQAVEDGSFTESMLNEGWPQGDEESSE